MDEARFYDATSFLTLTYDDKFLPEAGTLVPEHLSAFVKRLRAHAGSQRLRFFGCGEYGDITLRPHYHAVILGYDFRHDRVIHKRGEAGQHLYTSPRLSRLWPHGFATIGTVTHDSAGYVAGYCLKKVTGDREKVNAHYQGREPEFMRCSHKIGLRYFEQYKSDLYPDDFQVYKGRKMRVPRYYDKQLSEEELALYKERRRVKAEEHSANNTPERLAVRETVARARASIYAKREI